MIFTTSKGVELTLTPVNKMLLLPLRDKFPQALKPAAPVDETEIGPVVNTDSPEYENMLEIWATGELELMQDVYFEFGIEDFEFDLNKVDKHRKKCALLLPNMPMPKSDKRLYIQHFLCSSEDEYIKLFNTLVNLTEPSLEQSALAREMFSSSVPG